jgi:hypothetical protein
MGIEYLEVKFTQPHPAPVSIKLTTKYNNHNFNIYFWLVFKPSNKNVFCNGDELQACRALRYITLPLARRNTRASFGFGELNCTNRKSRFFNWMGTKLI